jgi:hypothetical protein
MEDEFQRAWSEHGADPGGVADRLEQLADRITPTEVPKLAQLVVHVLGEHLAEYQRGRRLIARMSELGRVAADGATSSIEALDRSLAVFALCDGELAEADALFAGFGSRRPSQEAWALALAAGAVSVHGRLEEASQWLARAATLAHRLPNGDPAVRAVAATANNVAVTLEGRQDRTPQEVSLLRSAAQVARIAWERAGTWLEVERAEYRLAATSLSLGEPHAAVAHAEACLLVCLGNEAPAYELAYAYEMLARTRHALGDDEGARTARDALATISAAVPPGSEILARIDALLGSG